MAAASVVISVLFEEDLTWGVGFAVPFAGLAALHWLSAAWIDRHGSWS